MRLIIVEDEKMFADNLKKLLELKGFAVDWLQTADQALNRILLYQKEYDMILLDLNMPGMNGMELTQKLRSAGITVPIIIVTGNSDTENKIALLNQWRRRLSRQTIFGRRARRAHQLCFATSHYHTARHTLNRQPHCGHFQPSHQYQRKRHRAYAQGVRTTRMLRAQSRTSPVAREPLEQGLGLRVTHTQQRTRRTYEKPPEETTRCR